MKFVRFRVLPTPLPFGSKEENQALVVDVSLKTGGSEETLTSLFFVRSALMTYFKQPSPKVLSILFPLFSRTSQRMAWHWYCVTDVKATTHLCSCFCFSHLL